MLLSDCILRLNPARNSLGRSALALPRCGGASVPGAPWPAVAALVVPWYAAQVGEEGGLPGATNQRA